MKHFDVDIDVAPSFLPVEIFGDTVVRASIYQDQDKKLVPHPCGVYFQAVPKDPITGLAAAPYKTAETLGCFKIDFLHVNVYEHFTSKEEIKELIKIEPDWMLLEIPSVVDQLFQLGKHYDLVKDVKPRSVIEVADCVALIRPQKKFMVKAYLKDRARIRRELYKFEGDGYAFKKAHAVAYAYVVILQLHLIKAGLHF